MRRAMLTTITTTTTTMVTLTQAAFFSAIGVVTLIALLITKELLSASVNERAIFLSRITATAINPLIFVFVAIVVVKVMEVI